MKMEHGMNWSPANQLCEIIPMQDAVNQVHVPNIATFTTKKQAQMRQFPLTSDFIFM